ncbi:hypothetical protein TrLO_g9879 [Triparma laevis f. longispina]|uniref:J domain-containing protein n=1 Tax=Triparma laevis f. longispina TaxID=1714387 RepID=A0A9W7FDU4_9STRA|nr:hypothetical protein TrLO_g9879 [Triparma laevis f. longispina]
MPRIASLLILLLLALTPSAAPFTTLISSSSPTFHRAKTEGLSSSSSSSTSESPPPFTSSTNFYDVLGFDRNSSPEPSDLKISFLTLAKLHHPDVSSSPPSVFSLISEAYEVLSDPKSKSHYDLTGETNSASGGSSRRQGVSNDAWEEYVRNRPQVKKSRRRQATVKSAVDFRGGVPEIAEWSGCPDVPDYLKSDDLAAVGDVVIFGEKEEKRVGLVVSRNIDRGDVKLLLETLSGMYKVGTPEYETAKVKLLEKCEVSTLSLKEDDGDGGDRGESTWYYDINSVEVKFPLLTALKKIEVVDVHEGLEEWKIVDDFGGESLRVVCGEEFDFDDMIV